MILPFSQPRVADSHQIRMNFRQLARLRAMAGTACGKLDYRRRSGAGVPQICLKSAVSLAACDRRDKSHRANAGIFVADTSVQWMISGEGREEQPKCN
jgi:hypothetical protein